MRELQASAVIVCTLFLFNGRITAQSFVFDTPDAAIPGIPADGLDGLIWSSPSIAPVNDLVAVAAYIASNDPQASFVSTVVDYPNGNVGSIDSTSTFNFGLGVDAPSISDPVIGMTAVANSIMQLTGFLRIETPGIIPLGLASDDGSALFIQGVEVVNNDGIHQYPGPTAGPVGVDFTTPGLYALEIRQFDSEVERWGVLFSMDTKVTDPVPAGMLQRTIPEPAAIGLMLVGMFVVSLRLRP
jgi:hypothetical protein